MTKGYRKADLALLVRSIPYHQRSARAQLDIALAAAVLEMRLELYFIGSAIFQLVSNRDVGPAMLPAGHRGWASLPELTDCAFFGERLWIDCCQSSETRLMVELQDLDAAGMMHAWRRCQCVLLV